jgi:hypothetical protein
MKQMAVALLRRLPDDRYPDFIYWWQLFRNAAPKPTGRPKLVVLNHMFDQDIEALSLANDAFDLIPIDPAVLRAAATHVFAEDVERYATYNSDRLAAKRARYRKVVERFVDRMIARWGPVAVVAPSDNFFYVRELIPALRARGIPYLVIDKEGTICPAYFVHFAQYIKDECPFISEHILVWTERQRDFWQRTGVPAERITVTGQPRSDFWKQPSRWIAKDRLGIAGLRRDAKLVLFFSYDPWAYTPDYMIERGEMHWEVLRSETHAAIYAFAARHPELDVVIKAHPQQPDVDTLRDEARTRGLANILIATGPKLSNQLIASADCVVGFQTTALIEAMITDTPIIYTFWGEARDRWSADLIPFHETRGIDVAGSPVELEAQLEAAVASPALSGEQKRARADFVETYLGHVDGQSSRRTLVRIQELLKISPIGRVAPVSTSTTGS